MKKIFFAILTFNIILSQISLEGTPKSLLFELNNSIPDIVMPTINEDVLWQQDELENDKNIPFRFGAPIDVSFNLNNSGIWEETELGRVWRLSITSENAYSINLLYDRFVIPNGAEMFVYDEDMNTILGAFTSLNNKTHETFSTAPTKGQNTIIEYFEPYDSDFNGEIQISRVVHAYKDIFYPDESRDYGDSGSCNNNVNCPEFVDWADEVRSVAMILSGGGFRLCTGSLVNNVRQDLTPYFLTANHCLGGESSWIFMFNYESPGCNNQNGPTYMTVQGSTLLDNSSSSDFALLRLQEDIPDSYEVHYAGWDASGNTPSTPVGIHHPSGDIKKISFDYNNASNAGNYWDVDNWEDGTTEPGSSGSPLFDGSSHRIVGQLYGGTASCTSITYDTYGKVSTSWGLGLRDYLDPDNTGTTVLDGMDAIDLPDPELSYDINELYFELNSDETQTTSMTISNIGETDSELNYTINSSPFEVEGGGPDDGQYFWTDSNLDDNTDYNWIDISDIGTLYSFPNNDQSGEWLPIEFNFPFYTDDISNNYYDQLFINPNGWVGFDYDDDSWDNTSIPTQTGGATIFALWDDLNPVNEQCNQYCAGNVYYHSNEERFVVWFDQVAHWWTNFENTFYDFQVVLYPSGKIDLNYRNLIGDYDASVGIQKNSTIGTQVMYGTDDLENNFNITFESSPNWLSINPNQGMLMNGESRTINITSNSSNLSDGLYNAFLRITSDGGNASLPVSMLVNGSLLGDTNGDSLINVLDVIIIVNMILEEIAIDLNTADINSDGLVNVSDIILLINMILA
tara:strand:+ start:432 stop:2822 length:2391 start_codon:yes stop_codon:yes gene_type:complete